jgi:hypothetical protein
VINISSSSVPKNKSRSSHLERRRAFYEITFSVVVMEAKKANISTLSQAHGFFVQEERQLGKSYSTEEKREVLSEIEGKSSDQTEKVLKTLSPEQAKPEKKRRLNQEQSELRLTISEALLKKLERLKNLLGHQKDAQTYAGLIEKLADRALKELDPMEKPGVPPLETKSSTRYISEKTKRAVWHRDGGRCTYKAQDGMRCDSTHALEFEHIFPSKRAGSRLSKI